mmetsp:Transcript_1158/g.3704  ORF Transcript_1158/g.3704 Transcript_1158/m.3704 type:complete len:474 (+) Transcript_1158:2483-3904(+)
MPGLTGRLPPPRAFRAACGVVPHRDGRGRRRALGAVHAVAAAPHLPRVRRGGRAVVADGAHARARRLHLSRRIAVPPCWTGVLLAADAVVPHRAQQLPLAVQRRRHALLPAVADGVVAAAPARRHHLWRVATLIRRRERVLTHEQRLRRLRSLRAVLELAAALDGARRRAAGRAEPARLAHAAAGRRRHAAPVAVAAARTRLLDPTHAIEARLALRLARARHVARVARAAREVAADGVVAVGDGRRRRRACRAEDADAAAHVLAGRHAAERQLRQRVVRARAEVPLAARPAALGGGEAGRGAVAAGRARRLRHAVAPHPRTASRIARTAHHPRRHRLVVVAVVADRAARRQRRRLPAHRRGRVALAQARRVVLLVARRRVALAAAPAHAIARRRTSLRLVVSLRARVRRGAPPAHAVGRHAARDGLVLVGAARRAAHAPRVEGGVVDGGGVVGAILELTRPRRRVIRPYVAPF